MPAIANGAAPSPPIGVGIVLESFDELQWLRESLARRRRSRPLPLAGDLSCPVTELGEPELPGDGHKRVRAKRIPRRL